MREIPFSEFEKLPFWRDVMDIKKGELYLMDHYRNPEKMSEIREKVAAGESQMGFCMMLTSDTFKEEPLVCIEKVGIV